jgi:hypothetical protein
MLVALMAAASLTQAGCTFFACSGGEPLSRAELGDWAGIRELERPDASTLDYLREEDYWPPLSVNRWDVAGDSLGFSLTVPGDPWSVPFTPLAGYRIRFKLPHLLRLLPSVREGVYLYLPRHGSRAREFYAAKKEHGGGLILGDLLYAGYTANAYDAATHERVAAAKSTIVLGWGLLYTRYRRVLPVDEDGDKGLGIFAGGRASPSRVRYDVKDGTISLLGLIGWGRVNRKRYLQLLWIPIPIGTVDA